MQEWSDWSDWIKEGWYISYERDMTRYFERVLLRDFGHYEYKWPETITAGATSGPYTPEELEITRGYEASNNTNQLWQIIFGIKGQVYIYIELPTDLHRHGIPKIPKPSADHREVSHFTEWMSPFHEPSFITEHFMMRPETLQISFDGYNPNAIDMPGVILNIFFNKLQTERIGTVSNSTQSPAKPIYADILDKLYKQTVPCRPITIQPVRAPAQAPSGE
jgi:hypothetical protein